MLMKRFFNRALFFKEWKAVKWVSILLFIEILYYKSMVIIENIDYIKNIQKISPNRDREEALITLFNNDFIRNFDNFVLILVVTMVFLAIILMKHERAAHEHMLVASMPFTRKEIIGTKWISGALGVILPFAIHYILLNLIRVSNYSLIGSYMEFSTILKWLLLYLLTALSVFTFSLFVQTVMGGYIYGGIVGLILLYTPAGLSNLIAFYLQVMGVSMKYLKNIYHIGNRMSVFSYISDYGWLDHKIIYHNFGLNTAILLVSIIVFLLLSFYTYRRNLLENIGNLILFKPLEPFFKVGFSICFALTAALIIPRLIRIEIGVRSQLIALGIVNLIFGYFIANKIIRITSKSV